MFQVKMSAMKKVHSQPVIGVKAVFCDTNIVYVDIEVTVYFQYIVSPFWGLTKADLTKKLGLAPQDIVKSDAVPTIYSGDFGRTSSPLLDLNKVVGSSVTKFS